MTIRWGRLFRRTAAVFLAVMALWLLVMGAGAGAVSGVADAMGRSEALMTTLLEGELGAQSPDGLSLLERLVVDQSPLLSANLNAQREEEEKAAPTATPEPLPDAQPAPDRDDMEEFVPETTAAPGDIVERTLVPSPSAQGYVTGAGLYLYNRTGEEVDLGAVAKEGVDITLAPAENGPQILIIHSHATEAYTPDGTDVYAQSDYSRTLEEEDNMLRVGDEMERVFTELGLNVIHDRGLYDYPQYNGSYSRSGPAVEDYLAQYPTIRLVLDVHRDALVGEEGEIYKAVTTIDGVKTAQVMLVVGSGEEHPNWRENLTLAAKLQKSLDTLYPTLARPMILRGSVYNQDLSTGSLLVEVGCHGNTLQEALAGARLFARAAGSVFLGLEGE